MSHAWHGSFETEKCSTLATQYRRLLSPQPQLARSAAALRHEVGGARWRRCARFLSLPEPKSPEGIAEHEDARCSEGVRLCRALGQGVTNLRVWAET